MKPKTRKTKKESKRAKAIREMLYKNLSEKEKTFADKKLIIDC